MSALDLMTDYVGANKFDAEDFNVDFAYTADGGPLGELIRNLLSAAGAELHSDVTVHPGTLKDKMVVMPFN